MKTIRLTMMKRSCARGVLTLVTALAVACAEDAASVNGSGGGIQDAAVDAVMTDLAAGDSSRPDAATADAVYGGTDGGGCTAGVPRCQGDYGYEICEQDGTWSAPRNCAGYSENGTASYCSDVPNPGGGTWAACMDPACWYWMKRGVLGGTTRFGFCTAAGTIRACGEGGTLSPAAACEGVCTQVGMLDGRALGHCEPQCQDGARACLGGSLYKECASGRWLDRPKECPNGDLCQPLPAGARPDIKSGGDRKPATTRCSADGVAVESCGANGQWEASKTCALGRCRSAGLQAQCEAECTAGQFQCGHDGASAMRACDSGGRWTTETMCPAGTTCRFNGTVALGCVACVGSASRGGNAYGLIDSRCEPGGVGQCKDGNVWQPATACATGTTCVQLRQGASTVAHCQR